MNRGYEGWSIWTHKKIISSFNKVMSKFKLNFGNIEDQNPINAMLGLKLKHSRWSFQIIRMEKGLNLAQCKWSERYGQNAI